MIILQEIMFEFLDRGTFCLLLSAHILCQSRRVVRGPRVQGRSLLKHLLKLSGSPATLCCGRSNKPNNTWSWNFHLWNEHNNIYLTELLRRHYLQLMPGTWKIIWNSSRIFIIYLRFKSNFQILSLDLRGHFQVWTVAHGMNSASQGSSGKPSANSFPPKLPLKALPSERPLCLLNLWWKKWSVSLSQGRGGRKRNPFKSHCLTTVRSPSRSWLPQLWTLHSWIHAFRQVLATSLPWERSLTPASS